MNNLADSGLNLRNIEIRNLAQIVSDVNYNFTQMLQLSGFRGLVGESGQSIIGDKGERGNVWIFANSIDFINNYAR